MTADSIIDSMDIEYINPKEARFNITTSHILTLDLNGVHYPCVQLHRSFPFTNPDKYIAVRDDDDSDKDKVREIGNDKKKEVGMIRDLNEFDDVTRNILERYLELRYFAPVIKKLVSVKEEFGYRYWVVDTDKGRCKFTTTLNRNSIINLSSSDRVMIYDVDGNRFQIIGFSKFDSKGRKQIEMFM